MRRFLKTKQELDQDVDLQFTEVPANVYDPDDDFFGCEEQQEDDDFFKMDEPKNEAVQQFTGGSGDQIGQNLDFCEKPTTKLLKRPSGVEICETDDYVVK